MATGLLYVSAKPLALRPSALTTLAMKPHFKNKDWQLQPYDVMRYQWQGHPPGLALSLVDLDSTKEKVADPPSLPPLPRNSVDTEQENQKRSAKATAPDENSEDNMPGDEADLPPELIPVLQDDGLPLLEEGEDLQAIVMDESDGSEDFDIYDIKHTPDFDPDQDYERKFFTYDIDTWVKADQKEAVEGARPRIYEMLNVPKEPIIDMIRSDHYDASPLTRESLPERSPCSTERQELRPITNGFSFLNPGPIPFNLPNPVQNAPQC